MLQVVFVELQDPPEGLGAGMLRIIASALEAAPGAETLAFVVDDGQMLVRMFSDCTCCGMWMLDRMLDGLGETQAHVLVYGHDNFQAGLKRELSPTAH